MKMNKHFKRHAEDDDNESVSIPSVETIKKAIEGNKESIKNFKRSMKKARNDGNQKQTDLYKLKIAKAKLAIRFKKSSLDITKQNERLQEQKKNEKDDYSKNKINLKIAKLKKGLAMEYGIYKKKKESIDKRIEAAEKKKEPGKIKKAIRKTINKSKDPMSLNMKYNPIIKKVL